MKQTATICYVSLFNVLFTSVGYLIPMLFLQKNSFGIIQSIERRVREFPPFPRVILWKWTS